MFEQKITAENNIGQKKDSWGITNVLPRHKCLCVYISLSTLPHTHEQNTVKFKKVLAYIYFKHFKLGETHYSITIGYTPIYDSCK